MGELFDRYVVVDWSAAGRPTLGRDSIWIAVVDDRPRARVRRTNPSTRHQAAAELAGLNTPELRVLVAVDASLGYPQGTAAWFGLEGPTPWRAMWSHLAADLVDAPDNANDRFEMAARLNRRRGGEGPFWGRPATAPIDGIGTRKPAAMPLHEFRIAETRLRSEGRRPASCWQLLGAGSVGSQTLTLLPILHRMLLAGSVEVWPFTTGLTTPVPVAGVAVVAETWPTAFELDLSRHEVRDEAQVDGVVRRLRAVDRAGELAAWFAPEVEPEQRHAVETEEGWALTPPRSEAHHHDDTDHATSGAFGDA